MGFLHENVCWIIVLLGVIMYMSRDTVALVHQVGGSAGWTILGKVDYNKWTSTTTFTTADSLLFVYNSKFHNVKQVTRRDFLSCNATSAIATYTSGSDTVSLPKPGHFYFLCGFPGHCQAGQKLHVLVVDTIAVDSPSPSPAFAPSSSPSPTTASKETAFNGAVSMTVTSAMIGVVVFLVALVLYTP